MNCSLISLHKDKKLPKILYQGFMNQKGFILKLSWVISVSYCLAFGIEEVSQDLTTPI